MTEKKRQRGTIFLVGLTHPDVLDQISVYSGLAKLTHKSKHHRPVGFYITLPWKEHVCHAWEPQQSSVQFSCSVVSNSLWPHGLHIFPPGLPGADRWAWYLFHGRYWDAIISRWCEVRVPFSPLSSLIKQRLNCCLICISFPRFSLPHPLVQNSGKRRGCRAWRGWLNAWTSG